MPPTGRSPSPSPLARAGVSPRIAARPPSRLLAVAIAVVLVVPLLATPLGALPEGDPGRDPADAFRDAVLARSARMAFRLDDLRAARGEPFVRAWMEVPLFSGIAMTWEAMPDRDTAAARRLWRLLDDFTAAGNAPITHGDWAGYAQCALDAHRLLPADSPRRIGTLATTDEPLAFARRALHGEAEAGNPPVDGWWTGTGYGTRYWQDDFLTIVPFLAMRGSARPGLPNDTAARDLAYEWIEAYAFDHRKSPDRSVPDASVATLPSPRLSGWDRSDPSTGRFLRDPASHLWWHDAGTVGSSVFWTRGNGWVAAGLARAQRFLDRPYGGSRFDRVPTADEIRAELAAMAATLRALRNPFGLWNSSLLPDDRFVEPESSGSALLLYMMAVGVNDGWLPRDEWRPVVLKGFRALSLRVDGDGDLHGIQRIGDAPDAGRFYASDELPPELDPRYRNFDYGVGAFLMLSAEVAAFGLDEPLAAAVPDSLGIDLRSARRRADGTLAIPLPPGGTFRDRALRPGAALGAIWRFESFPKVAVDGATMVVDDRGAAHPVDERAGGRIVLFVAAPGD